MKRHFVAGIFVLAGACAVCAQDLGRQTVEPDHNVAMAFTTTLDSGVANFAAPALNLNTNLSLTIGTSIFASPAGTLDAFAGAPDPAPKPAPEPKFLYGGRDDYRFQLGIGADWIRFRSSIFDASEVGIKTSVAYFTNDWFAVEGVVDADFSTDINGAKVKILVYGAGPKIAWRERKWEPWIHGIVGGTHEQPQTAGNSKNALAAEAGGGADYRFNPRFSGRLEADWIRTGYFSQSQNDFELMGGVVFHF